MRRAEALRVVAVAVLLSTAAPAVLVASGVADRDLLLVVFVPSLVVGLVTAWYAGRRPHPGKAWLVDTRRMP